MDIGTNVRLRVEDVDRSKIDPRNIIGVVISVNDCFYEIGTVGGKLKQLYARNQIEPCPSNFIKVEDVPDKVITLREAVGTDSLSGKQGLIYFKSSHKIEMIAFEVISIAIARQNAELNLAHAFALAFCAIADAIIAIHAIINSKKMNEFCHLSICFD